MIDNKQPPHRYRPSTQRRRAAVRQAQERRRNLENGGLEKLDVADLKKRLAERRVKDDTGDIQAE